MPEGYRQVLLYPGQDGFWVVECLSLPGCVSQGDTREAAVQNIREAIEGYVLALEDDGIPLCRRSGPLIARQTWCLANRLYRTTRGGAAVTPYPAFGGVHGRGSQPRPAGSGKE